MNNIMLLNPSSNYELYDGSFRNYLHGYYFLDLDEPTELIDQGQLDKETNWLPYLGGVID